MGLRIDSHPLPGTGRASTGGATIRSAALTGLGYVLTGFGVCCLTGAAVVIASTLEA